MVLSVVSAHRDPWKHTAVEHIEYPLWFHVCNSCERQLSPNDGRTYGAMERMVTWCFFDFNQLCQKVLRCWNRMHTHIYHSISYLFLSSSTDIHVCVCVFILGFWVDLKVNKLKLVYCVQTQWRRPYWNMCGCLMKIWHVSRYQVSQVSRCLWKFTQKCKLIAHISTSYTCDMQTKHQKTLCTIYVCPPAHRASFHKRFMKQPPNSTCRHRFPLLWRLLWRQFTWKNVRDIVACWEDWNL